MTTEEKAKAYAEKRTEDCVSEHYGSMMMRRRVQRFDSYDIEQAYEDAIRSPRLAVERPEGGAAGG